MTEAKQPGTRIARACPDCGASLETSMTEDRNDSSRLIPLWVCFRRCGYVFDLDDLKRDDLKGDEPYAYRSASGDVWEPPDRYKLLTLAHLMEGLVTCQCGEINGCEEDAVDVWIDDDSETWALCSRCLKECTVMP